MTPGGAIRVYALGNAFLDPTGATDPFDGKGRCCSDTAFANLKAGAFGMPTTSNPGVAYAQLNRNWYELRGLDGRGIALAGLGGRVRQRLQFRRAGRVSSRPIASRRSSRTPLRLRARLKDCAMGTCP